MVNSKCQFFTKDAILKTYLRNNPTKLTLFDEAIRFAFNTPEEATDNFRLSIINLNIKGSADRYTPDKKMFTHDVQTQWTAKWCGEVDPQSGFDKDILVIKYSGYEAGNRDSRHFIPYTLKILTRKDPTNKGLNEYMHYRLLAVLYETSDGMLLTTMVTKTPFGYFGDYFKCEVLPDGNNIKYAKIPTNKAEALTAAFTLSPIFSQMMDPRNTNNSICASGSVWIASGPTNKQETECNFLTPPQSLLRIGEYIFNSEHIRRLKGDAPYGGWLEDEFINGFFMLGVLHYNRPGTIAMSSHFFSAYCGYAKKITSNTLTSYDTVKKWTKDFYEEGKSLFDTQNILHIPIQCNGNHWIYAFVVFATKSICVVDSKGPNIQGKAIGKQILEFLALEFREKCDQQVQFPKKQWKVEVDGVCCPRQDDGFNCGIFVLLNFVHCMEFDYRQSFHWNYYFKPDTLKEIRETLVNILLRKENFRFESLVEYAKRIEILTTSNNMNRKRKSTNRFEPTTSAKKKKK